MVTRRRTLQLGAAALAAVSGCLGRQTGSGTPTPEGTATGTPGETPTGTPDATPEQTPEDVPTRTPDDVPEWEPTWTMPFEGWRVLGLEIFEDRLYASLNSTDGSSAVAAVDPATRELLWQTESEGETVTGAQTTHRSNSRGRWRVSATADRVFTIAGFVSDREWSAIHALDRATGDRQWSIRRQRDLSIAGITDTLVVATGEEFFPPPGETPAPTHTTPESPLSTAIYGLHPADGTVRWQTTLDAVEDVAVGSGRVYVAAGQRLVGLDHEGTRQFTYDHGPARTVEVGDGRAFYLTGEEDTATLHALDPSGKRRWRQDSPGRELLLDGGRVYAAGSAVVALTASGETVWRHNAPGRWLLLAPGREQLYARSGRQMDGATAYDTDAGPQWRFAPPSNNAWPEAATDDAILVEAITGSGSAEPFKTIYAVDADGHATAALGRDTVFDALGFDGRFYLADGVSNLVALES